jgi:hypothetical protein
MRDAKHTVRVTIARNMAIGIACVAAVLVAEITLWIRWVPWYFRSGIPIFLSRAARAEGLETVSFDGLQKRIATAVPNPYAFRRLESGEIAFREQSVTHYVPLMRGLIRHDATEGMVVVLGFINWTFVALVAVFALLMRRHFKDVALYLGIAFAVLYLVQGVRYWRLARALEVSRTPTPTAGPHH